MTLVHFPRRSRRWTTCLASLSAGLATPALAQRDVGGGFSVTGSVTGVTDYRYRGISRSDRDPAIQGTLNLDHVSGLYGGVWASSLADTPLYGEAEINFYVGYGREVAPATTFDAGLLYYYFPGNDGRVGPSDYFEPYASISHTIGPVTAKVGATYAWEQEATGGEDNLYVFTDLTAGIPGAPVSIVGHVGYSDGVFAPGGDYFDWRVGLEFTQGPATIGLAYVDADLNGDANTDATFMASLRLGF